MSSITEAPRLTVAGRMWAKAHRSDSWVALVALGGGGDAWKPHHRAEAVRVCNASGDGAASEPRTGYELREGSRMIAERIAARSSAPTTRGGRCV